MTFGAYGVHAIRLGKRLVAKHQATVVAHLDVDGACPICKTKRCAEYVYALTQLTTAGEPLKAPVSKPSPHQS